MHRPIDEARAEYVDCLNCKRGYDCLSMSSDCPKQSNIEHYHFEYLRAITANTPPDVLETLCAAWADGRVVVLPVKVGDTVKVRSDTWGNVWNYKTVESGNFLIGEIVSITKTKKQTLMKIQAAHNVSWKRPRKRYSVNALGITVFPLTASALQEEQKNG